MAAQVDVDVEALLDEEAEALEAIYGEEVRIITEPEREVVVTIPTASSTSTTASTATSSSPANKVTLHLRLGPEYPMASFPAELNLETNGLLSFDERAVTRDDMKSLWSPGEACVFAMVECVREAVLLKEAAVLAEAANAAAAAAISSSSSTPPTLANLSLDNGSQQGDRGRVDTAVDTVDKHALGTWTAAAAAAAADGAQDSMRDPPADNPENTTTTLKTSTTAATVDTTPTTTNTNAATSTATATANVSRVFDFTFHPPYPKFGQRPKHFTAASNDPVHELQIVSGEPILERKSTFQAHLAVGVTSKAQVDWVMRRLLSENNKVARATHNIMAYRFIDPLSGRIVADNDEDGEDGAGAKVAQLLVAMKCGWSCCPSPSSASSSSTPSSSASHSSSPAPSTRSSSPSSSFSSTTTPGVLVVVSRWYGGVHLGPDRFRIINNTARALLAAHGFGGQQQPGPSSSAAAARETAGGGGGSGSGSGGSSGAGGVHRRKRKGK